MMNVSEVMNKVNEWMGKKSSTKLGHNLVAIVPLKASRVRKDGKHLVGRAVKVTLVTNCTFPKYASKVFATSGAKVTPQKPNGMTWLLFPYVKQADKSGLSYLNVYYAATDTKIRFESRWMLDGKLATPAQADEIVSYLHPSSKGNSDVLTAMYQVDNIRYLGDCRKDAEKIFAELIGD